MLGTVVVAAGVTFDSFSPGNDLNYVFGNEGGRVGDTYINGTSVLEDCIFSNNQGTIIDVDHGYASLQGVTFTNNTHQDGGEAMLVRYRSGAGIRGAQKVVFSDEPVTVHKRFEELQHQSSVLSEIPPEVAERMLSLSDEWIVQTMQVRVPRVRFVSL